MINFASVFPPPCFRGSQGKKCGIACFLAAQIFTAAVLWILLPVISNVSTRLHSLSRSNKTHRNSLTGTFSSFFRHNQPTVLVGVFITNTTSSSRLSAFRRSFQVARSFVSFNLHYVFVVGNSQFEDQGHGEALRLPIHENIDEGKTFQYFQAAIDWFSSHNVPYHPLNGIVKMDTDTAVDWPAFSSRILPRLEPMYYLGRSNSRSVCGNLHHCPPSDCHDFSDGCWVYMSGGWYALSLDLAKAIILNCSYSASHTLGYEDLTVGTWISHCSYSVRVFHVDNGDFFCHSSFILDQHIRDMQFPQRWFFFGKVSCLGSNGDVKWTALLARVVECHFQIRIAFLCVSIVSPTIEHYIIAGSQFDEQSHGAHN
jgi:hypothetical protein